MKFLNKQIAFARVLSLLVVGSIFSSFAGIKGGDTFEVFLNNKKVFHQIVYGSKEIKSFSIDRTNQQDKLKVVYRHCGQVGKERSISLVNTQNKKVKEWKFENSAYVEAGMSWQASEILNLVKEKSASRFDLVYKSAELPDGKVLATIDVRNTSTELGKLK